ncbi:MAG: proton-conducting transporter membrane subunit, partial [Terriglobia bacterium]
AVIGMIAHGISTGALFTICGQVQERTHTREMGRLSGLWATVPRLSGASMFFAMGSMGLPGLGDFIGEFLVLIGTYEAHLIGITIATTIGILLSTLYALRFIQRAFHGPNSNNWKVQDLVPREVVMLVPMVAILIWLGIYPQPVFDVFNPSSAVTMGEQVDRVVAQRSQFNAAAFPNPKLRIRNPQLEEPQGQKADPARQAQRVGDQR